MLRATNSRKRLRSSRTYASVAADNVQSQVREQQQSGADFIVRFAGNIREAARPFEKEAAFAGGIDRMTFGARRTAAIAFGYPRER
jgi:hypothetical protein